METAIWILVGVQVVFLILFLLGMGEFQNNIIKQNDRLMATLDQMNWNLQNINNNVRELDYRYQDRVEEERRRYD